MYRIMVDKRQLIPMVFPVMNKMQSLFTMDRVPASCNDMQLKVRADSAFIQWVVV